MRGREQVWISLDQSGLLLTLPRPVRSLQKGSTISLFNHVIYALGTGLYLGLVPPRLGTLGAALGIPLAWGLHQVFTWPLYVGMTLVLCLVGVFICKRSAELIGRKDPSEVTYDEIATIPLVFIGIQSFTPTVLLVGFALHRLWDVAKPWIINDLQKLPGGWGIMADDVAAGLAACACLHLLIWIGLFQWLGGV